MTRGLLLAAAAGLLAQAAVPTLAQDKGAEAKCAAQAKTWFAKAHPEAKKMVKGYAREVVFRSRFNGKRKQCLVLEEIIVSSADKAVARAGRQLFVLQDGRRSPLGRVVGPQPLTCEFEGRKCASMQEWDKLAAAAMQ